MWKIFGIIAVCLLSGGSDAFAGLWEITDLGTLGGRASYARDINNQGQVIGESDLLLSGSASFLWENGSMANIGNFHSTKINDNGQVIGHVIGTIYDQPVLWEEGEPLTFLGSLGGNEGKTNDINEDGQIVGKSTDNAGVPKGFSWGNGVMTELSNIFGSGGGATTINDQGWMAGQAKGSIVGWGLSKPALFKDDNLTLLNSLIHNGDGYINQINNNGKMVGYSRNNQGTFDAVLWNLDGSVFDLSTSLDESSYSSAKDINNFGQVVGTFNSSVFLWENNIFTDLNDLLSFDSGWVLENVGGINDLGQIVGTGMFEGQQRAFLLSQFLEQENPSVVPEPATVLLFGFGLFALLGGKNNKFKI